MVREIKVRVWDKNKKLFLPEDSIAVLSGQGQLFVMIKDFENYREGEYGYADSFELIQFTGLLDKNGKEIYEGDIITHNKYTKESGRNEQSNPKIVYWDDTKAGFEQNPPNNYQSGMFYSEYTIIGNKYSNPELLN